jgi:hypothetical protein
VATGPVEKIKVYHTNPEGVVTIKFHDQPAAEQVRAVIYQAKSDSVTLIRRFFECIWKR